MAPSFDGCSSGTPRARTRSTEIARWTKAEGLFSGQQDRPDRGDDLLDPHEPVSTTASSMWKGKLYKGTAHADGHPGAMGPGAGCPARARRSKDEEGQARLRLLRPDPVRPLRLCRWSAKSRRAGTSTTTAPTTRASAPSRTSGKRSWRRSSRTSCGNCVFDEESWSGSPRPCGRATETKRSSISHRAVAQARAEYNRLQDRMERHVHGQARRPGRRGVLRPEVE